MLDVLLIVQMVIALLLVSVILLQKSNVDGTSGLGGGSGVGGGVVSAKTAANFFTRLTVILAFLFMVNAIALANLSGKKHTSEQKIEESLQTDSLPIAK
jgi:preprotein translocase subunit SecG